MLSRKDRGTDRIFVSINLYKHPFRRVTSIVT